MARIDDSTIATVPTIDGHIAQHAAGRTHEEPPLETTGLMVDTAPTADHPTRDEPEAIFVVGVSRSGTSLLRAVLESHSRVAIAPESHYLTHLLPIESAVHRFRRVGPPTDDDAVRRVAALIYSPLFQRGSRLRESSPFWRWLGKHVGQPELEDALLQAERTERGLFRALLGLYAMRRGKAIIGEKTPAHVNSVDTLIEWFPRGRVVHIVRDPRGVFVSELRRRTAKATTLPYRWLVRAPRLLEGFILVETAWAWATAVSRHRAYARTYADEYHLVRFEDLVNQPEGTIASLCAFLCLSVEPAMLEQKVVSRGTRLGQSGFDAEAADRWRESIGPRQKRILEVLLGRRLRQLGYPRT